MAKKKGLEKANKDARRLQQTTVLSCDILPYDTYIFISPDPELSKNSVCTDICTPQSPASGLIFS